MEVTSSPQPERWCKCRLSIQSLRERFADPVVLYSDFMACSMFSQSPYSVSTTAGRCPASTTAVSVSARANTRRFAPPTRSTGTTPQLAHSQVALRDRTLVPVVLLSRGRAQLRQSRLITPLPLVPLRVLPSVPPRSKAMELISPIHLSPSYPAVCT